MDIVRSGHFIIFPVRLSDKLLYNSRVLRTFQMQFRNLVSKANTRQQVFKLHRCCVSLEKNILLFIFLENIQDKSGNLKYSKVSFSKKKKCPGEAACNNLHISYLNRENVNKHFK